MSRSKKEAPLKRVTISVEPDVYGQIETLAEKSSLSAAWLIRKAMREFVDKWGEDNEVVNPFIEKGES